MPSIFTPADRQAIQERLLSEGEKMMLASGITRMNLETLAHSAGIAKGTFYNFFRTKQHFILAIIRRYQAQRAEVLARETRSKQNSLTADQAIQMYLSVYDPKENPFFRMRDRDLDWIAEKIPAEELFYPEMDLRCCGMILSCVKDLRKDVDLRIVSNFSRMIMFTLMQQDNVHKEVLPQNIKMIVELVEAYIAGYPQERKDKHEV